MDFAVNGKVVYSPHPKQLQFHQCPARYPLFGGARGPGKSHAIRWHMHMACMTVPHFNGLLLRRNLPDLRRSHGRYMAMEAQQLVAQWRPNANGAGEMHYPNGSILECNHCQHEDDYTIYLSAQYDGQAFDELVTFSEYLYLQIRSACRTTKPGLVARVLGATNPGVSPVNPGVPGLGESWVRRRWVDHDVTVDEDEQYREEDYAYIPARFEDNPHLQQDDYNAILGSLPPEVRRAYRDGDWDIFVGQFFPEFRKDWHVADVAVPVSDNYPRTCGLDWGYANEGVCLWGCVTPDGQLLIEDEYTFNGKRRQKQVAVEVAREIAQRNKDRGVRLRGTYADPAMFMRTGQVGQSIAEMFAHEGVSLTEANNDRINGWAKMRAWFRAMPAASGQTEPRPWLVIHPRCVQLIRTLPQLIMDPSRPEDIETNGPDHWADALRYLMAGRPAPTPDFQEQTYPKGTAGWMMEQMLSRSRRVMHLGSRNVRKPTYAY